MPQIDSGAAMAVQPELASGETIIWAGRPDCGVLFRRGDLFLIPFSLLWGGFAIVWEGGVSGLWGPRPPEAPSHFMMLWGIPFVIAGQYIIWGRFVHMIWKKKRTFYAVTSRRVIAVQHGSWTRQVASIYLDAIPMLAKESQAGTTNGTLRFAEREGSSRRGWSAWNIRSLENVPVFVDVQDAENLYQLIADLRAKTTLSQI